MTAGTVSAMTNRPIAEPSPFPFEGPEYDIRRRPPVRRPVEADDRDDSDTVLAAKIKAEAAAQPNRWATTHAGDWADIEATATRIRQQATPPGDPIARWVTTAAFALFVVFLLAGVTRGPNSGRVMLGCILTGLATCAAGWAAYAIRDRKAGA